MADQQEPSGFFSTITPAVVATLIVAVLSVLSALGVASYNANAQRELEREQFESNLILKAMGTGDKKLSYDNLRFLIEGGLIRKESEKVRLLLQDTTLHIHFPVDKQAAHLSESLFSYPQYPQGYSDPTFSGIVLDDATGQQLGGVTVSMKTNRSRPRAAESQRTGVDGLFTLHYTLRAFTLSYNLPGYVEQSTEYEINTRFKGPLVVRLKGLRAYHY